MNTKEPLVSIICTVKNGENTLDRTINSVMAQTYKNWEMIIIDDGSTDFTFEVLNHYSKICRKIYTFSTEGIGRGNALNKGISVSNGTLITILDADDLIHPEKLTLQVEMFKENDIFLVSTDTEIIYESDSPKWEDSKEGVIGFTDITKKILVKNIIHHSSVMMNKETLLRIGQYNTERTSQFDYELWLRAYDNNEKILNIDRKLTAKRIHSHQSYENRRRLKYILSSSMLQLKYNLKFKNYHLIIIFPVRLIFGMLPFKKRQFIKKILIP
ncbi:glycosyltransferase [Salinicoccus roseus]|uniref:glycosyltransferase n=1 Tax=Salinicoccus roseus TaxID=45670 RepID=UPI0035248DD6